MRGDLGEIYIWGFPGSGGAAVLIRAKLLLFVVLSTCVKVALKSPKDDSCPEYFQYLCSE